MNFLAFSQIFAFNWLELIILSIFIINWSCNTTGMYKFDSRKMNFFSKTLKAAEWFSFICRTFTSVINFELYQKAKSSIFFPLLTDVHLNRHIGPIPNSSNNLGTFLSCPNQRPPDAHRVRSGSFNPNILASSKLLIRRTR